MPHINRLRRNIRRSTASQLILIGLILLNCLPVGSALRVQRLVSAATGSRQSIEAPPSDALVNDPPTGIELSSHSVEDNSPAGTTVGLLSTSDADAGDHFTYTLVEGLGSIDNGSFLISGDSLQTRRIFDYETKSLYSLRVRTTDSAGGSFETQLLVNVTDGADDAGQISFASDSFSAGEAEAAAQIRLRRTGGADNEVFARVDLADVTTSQADYLFKPGRLDTGFNPGGTAATSGSSSAQQFVRAVALQPDGKILIGGAFLFYNGIVRNRIARLNVDGTLDMTFDPGAGANGHVFEIAVHADGKILIGGNFTRINGVSRNRIARLNSDGTLDQTFAPGTGFNGLVLAIVVQPDSRILVGGTFLSYNGVVRNQIARLNSDGTLDSSFDAGAGSGGSTDSAGVQAIMLQPDGKVVIGGGFIRFSGVQNTRLLRLNGDGSVDASFQPALGTSLAPSTLVRQPDGKLLVGGEGVGTDTPYGKLGIVRLNTDGSVDASFNPGKGVAGSVQVGQLQPDGKFIIGGFFGAYDGTPRGSIARLHADGSLDPSFNPLAGANSSVYDMAFQPDGRILIGGLFNFYDNVPSNGIARIAGDLFVRWAAGDDAEQTISLPLVNDTLVELNETLALTLAPLAGATAGTPHTSTLTILDNDTSIISVGGSGVYRGTATLEATLTLGGAPLGGRSINFILNNTFVGTATTDAEGVATLGNVSLAGINAGIYPHAVGAGFSGDASLTGSGGTGQLTVARAATQTLVNTSANPSSAGQSVTFTATVSSTAGTPTGSVQFKVDGANFGNPATLNSSGIATLTTSALTAGMHTINAVYSGDTNFDGSAATLAGGQLVGGLFEFSQTLYTIAERGSFITIIVRRTGDTSGVVSVDYASDDGSTASTAVPCSSMTGLALERCDFTGATGTLRFASGVTEQSFAFLVNDDAYTEGTETLRLVLSNPRGGAALGAQSTATLQITDDAPESTGSPLDVTAFFVRQHYLDFLRREPDAEGLAFWTHEINSCAASLSCREVRRINVSAAFFLSIEFQETGYLAYRARLAAFNHLPAKPVPITYQQMQQDLQLLAARLVVGAQGWQQQLEQNKQSYFAQLAASERFLALYPQTLSAGQFVDALNRNAAGALSVEESARLVTELQSNLKSRAEVLRAVAEDEDLAGAEKNRAFVLMQYFGYLRRNPDDWPEPTRDFAGYDFWLGKLNNHGGDYIAAEMIKAFIKSGEYQRRFGQ